MTERCSKCRFGTSLGSVGEATLARCGWVDESEDEAGDRMPGWAHEMLRDSPLAVGNDDRAETCAAYEEAAS